MPKPANTPVLTNDQAYDLLSKAQQLITMGWTKGKLAIDSNGHPVQPESERAIGWCELGAIQAAAFYQDNQQQEGPAYKYLLSVFNAANTNILAISRDAHSAVPNINDAHSTEHAQVIRMFEKSKNWLLRQEAKATTGAK